MRQKLNPPDRPMNTLIINPRGHRAEWAKANPQALIENGGLLSADDLSRWACDLCMAQLDPSRPIFCLGGPEGYSLCQRCTARQPQEDLRLGITVEFCQCDACEITEEVARQLKKQQLGRCVGRTEIDEDDV